MKKMMIDGLTLKDIDVIRTPGRVFHSNDFAHPKDDLAEKDRYERIKEKQVQTGHSNASR